MLAIILFFLGAWSPWSRWSDCNAQCQKLRSRDCTAPAPANGGHLCQGRNAEWRNCSGMSEFPHCLNPLQFPASSTTARVIEPYFSANLPTLVGLGFVGILLLIIAALVGALVRRKSRWRTRSVDGTPASLCKTYVEAARENINGNGGNGTGGLFLSEKGEKLYFPLNSNENDEGTFFNSITKKLKGLNFIRERFYLFSIYSLLHNNKKKIFVSTEG